MTPATEVPSDLSGRRIRKRKEFAQARRPRAYREIRDHQLDGDVGSWPPASSFRANGDAETFSLETPARGRTAEWMVESLYNFLESVIGSDLVKKTFWFFATIFIFILFVNWFGLIPGIGTVGWRKPLRCGESVPSCHAAAARRQRRSEHDVCHGRRLFVLWIVWAIQSQRCWR